LTFQVLDELTGALIQNHYFTGTFTNWIDAQDHASGSSLNTSNTNLTSACLYPTNLTTMYTTMLASYGAPGYTARDISFTGNNLSNNYVYSFAAGSINNDTTLNYTLYLSNGSTFVTAYVRDENNLPVNDSYFAVYKDFGGGNFTLIENIPLDYEGKAVMSVFPYTTWYKFIIYDTNQIYLSTSATKITTSPVYFNIFRGQQIFYSINTINNVLGNITYDNTTQVFTYTYVDPSATIRQACLNIVRRTPMRDINVSNQCSTSVSGVINYNISSLPATGIIIAKALIDTNSTNSWFLQDEYQLQLDQAYKTIFNGYQGILFTLIFVSVFGMMGLWNPTVAITLSILGLAVSGILGFISFSLGGFNLLIIILIVGIWSAWKTRT